MHSKLTCSQILDKFSHITPVLKSLHWLPVKYRSAFKTATIIYKHLNTGVPKYFSQYLTQYTCAINTRRSNPGNLFLNTPDYSPSTHTSKIHFNSSFSQDGPSLWNSLPHKVRSAPSLLTFRRRLKAHFYDVAYPHPL